MSDLLLNNTGPASIWRLTERKARAILESCERKQVVGLVIRDMDTGQTTVVDESRVVTLHPSEWREAMKVL